ncbi:MAG: M48 family metalloprotease [Nitratireductor sp.]
MPLGLSSCVGPDDLVEADQPSHTSSWIKPSDPQEKIGSREHPLVVAKYGGEYKNDKVEALLAVIVGRLIAVSEDKSRVYKVTVLNSPKVNAFALPGGFLYVTRGLVALANDTSELAAVLSHEMAHVSANHAILRNKQQAQGKVGKQVVNEVLGNTLASKVALAANKLRFSDFSKDQELQADAIGIRMLGNAGYDAHGAARFLQTMQAYQSLSKKSKDRFGDASFLSSHPTTPQRIELAKRHARFFGAPGLGEADRARYQKGIDGILFGDSSDEGFVRENSFSHAGLGITFSVPKGAKIENQSTSVIINGPDTLATRFDAAILGRFQSLGEYMKSGWVNGLDESSIQETVYNGLPVASAKAKGGDWDFVVQAILLDRQVYRFITAGPIGNRQILEASTKIAKSFRRLSEAEQAKLRPLKIKIVNVGAQDTLGSFAAKMKGTEQGLKMFQILNGLSAGQVPAIGSRVKIISD